MLGFGRKCLLSLVAMTTCILLTGCYCQEIRPPNKTLVLGYLGASNDTAAVRKVLQLIQDNLIVNSSLNSDIVHKLTNKCDVGEAIRNLFDLLHDTQEAISALVLYSCTEVLKVVGEFAPSINLTVFGLGSSSAVLKNAEKYPTLQLLSEVENSHSQTRVSFVEQEGWNKVATIAEDYEDFTLAAENFYEAAKNTSVVVDRSLTVAGSQVAFTNKIDELKKHDLRIIFMFGTRKILEKILLSMNSMDFFATKRVIVTNQDVSGVPRHVDLFYIGSSSIQEVETTKNDELSPIMNTFLEQFNDFLEMPPTLDSEDLKVHITEQFVYQGNFSTSIQRYNQSVGAYQLIATINNQEQDAGDIPQISWPGGNRPLDKKRKVVEYDEISNTVLYAFASLCVTASLLALAFLLMNCKYRHVRVIKMSSPRLNYFTIIGAIFLYGAVSIMGLGYPRISITAYRWICTTRNILLSGGYSFIFGPMCAKAYRVCYIFNSTRHGKVSRKNLKDRNLLLFTCALVVLDVIFIISWHLVDPFRIEKKEIFSPEKSDLDTDMYSYSHTCTSDYLTKWLGLVYAYKGMLLVWGVYLAWTTRNVSIPTLNDSKSIITNIYVVLAASVIIVIASIFLQHDATMSYSIVGSLILLSTTAMLGILFLPKMVALWRMPAAARQNKAEPVAMAGTGLVQFSNTRRLESDCSEEVRELELQSTVLNAELQKLDDEIQRLEKLSRKPNLQISDLFAEELLYIVPLTRGDGDIRSNKLTRKHTPKYQVKRKLQEEWVSKELQRKNSSSFAPTQKKTTPTEHGVDVEEENGRIFTVDCSNVVENSRL